MQFRSLDKLGDLYFFSLLEKVTKSSFLILVEITKNHRYLSDVMLSYSTIISAVVGIRLSQLPSHTDNFFIFTVVKSISALNFISNSSHATIEHSS